MEAWPMSAPIKPLGQPGGADPALMPAGEGSMAGNVDGADLDRGDDVVDGGVFGEEPAVTDNSVSPGSAAIEAELRKRLARPIDVAAALKRMQTADIEVGNTLTSVRKYIDEWAMLHAKEMIHGVPAPDENAAPVAPDEAVGPPPKTDHRFHTQGGGRQIRGRR